MYTYELAECRMTSNTTIHGPVLVVGAGIGGMAAALALAQSGFEVELFEHSTWLSSAFTARSTTLPSE